MPFSFSGGNTPPLDDTKDWFTDKDHVHLEFGSSGGNQNKRKKNNEESKVASKVVPKAAAAAAAITAVPPSSHTASSSASAKSAASSRFNAQATSSAPSTAPNRAAGNEVQAETHSKLSAAQFNSGIQPGYTGSPASAAPPLAIHSDRTGSSSNPFIRPPATSPARSLTQQMNTAVSKPDNGNGFFSSVGNAVSNFGHSEAQGFAKMGRGIASGARSSYNLMDDANKAAHPEQYNKKASNLDILKGGRNEALGAVGAGAALFGGGFLAAGGGAAELATAGGGGAVAGEQGAEKLSGSQFLSSSADYSPPSLDTSYAQNLSQVARGPIPGQQEMFPAPQALGPGTSDPSWVSRLTESAPKEFARLAPEEVPAQAYKSALPAPNIEGYSPQPLPSGALSGGQFSGAGSSRSLF